MGVPLALTRLPIARAEIGVLRVVAGAIVTIYDTMADGTSPVTAAGVVTVGAVKSTIYSDRTGVSAKTNPIIADAQGLIEFYKAPAEVHIHILSPDGVKYGIPWFSTGNAGFEVGESRTSVKSYPTFQAAVDSGASKVFIPAGDYHAGTVPAIESPLLLPIDRPIELVGEGHGNSASSRTSLSILDNRKDLNLIEMRGDNQKISNLNIYGPTLAGNGRGIQLGRVAVDTTGAPFKKGIIENVYFQGTASFAIGFYGSDSSFEIAENNPKTAVDANSICIDSVIRNIEIAGTKSKGGIYMGNLCTTLRLYHSLIVGWDGGPGVKMRFTKNCVLRDVYLEAPLTEQFYLYGDAATQCLFDGIVCEMHPGPAPTKYMIFMDDISNLCTFIAPVFYRPAGSDVAKFMEFNATDLFNSVIRPSAGMGTNSAGNSILKNGSNVEIIGLAKISQPSGVVDMVVA
jgi:hypothetical protein